MIPASDSPGSDSDAVVPSPNPSRMHLSSVTEHGSLRGQSMTRLLALLLVSASLSLLVSIAFYWFASQRSAQMWVHLIEQQYRMQVLNGTLKGWNDGARRAAFTMAGTRASGSHTVEKAWAEARQFGADTVASLNSDGTWDLAHGTVAPRLPEEGSIKTGWWLDGDAGRLYRMQFDFSQAMPLVVFYPLDQQWLNRHRMGYERVSLRHQGIELDSSAIDVSAPPNQDSWLPKLLDARPIKISVDIPLDQSATPPFLTIQHRIVPPFTFTDVLVTALLLLILLTVVGWTTLGRWLHEALERVENLAYRDPLTGLLNRHSLHQRLQAAMAAAQQDRRDGMALLMIDLDRFKELNDTLGHHAGDKLLIEIGSRLRAELRQDDVVARMGGDEFVAVIIGVREKTELTEIASRLIGTLAQPVHIAPHQSWSAGASIGIAVYPDDAQDQGSLLGHADLALYQSKRLGRGRYCFFDAKLGRDALIRMPLSSRREANLPIDQFWLAYQPILCAKTRSIAGMEALLRWQHPELGAINPGQFIPIAEETGIIGRLGLYVLESACKQFETWLRTQAPHFAQCRLYVNFSGQQLKDAKLMANVLGILDRTGFDARRLVIEVTETSFIEVTPDVLQSLSELRALGVTLAIDDFGTGHSSLSLVNKLPVQLLKLAGEFTHQLMNQPACSHSVCQNILNLAQSLGLATVAEGIETPEQARILTEMGYELLQGFYFAKPMAAGDLPTWLHQKAALENSDTMPRHDHGERTSQVTIAPQVVCNASAQPTAPAPGTPATTVQRVALRSTQTRNGKTTTTASEPVAP